MAEAAAAEPGTVSPLQDSTVLLWLDVAAAGDVAGCGGRGGGSAGCTPVNPIGAAFWAVDRPVSSVSGSPGVASRRARDGGGLSTDGLELAASTRWVSSADPSAFLFL